MTTDEERRIAVTDRSPPEWVDTVAKRHESGRTQLVPAEDRDAVTFTIPWDDGTTAEGTAFEDESDEANSFATTQPRQTGSPTGTARIS